MPHVYWTNNRPFISSSSYSTSSCFSFFTNVISFFPFPRKCSTKYEEKHPRRLFAANSINNDVRNLVILYIFIPIFLYLSLFSFFFTTSSFCTSSYSLFILLTLYLVKFLHGMFEDPEAKRWQEKGAKLFAFHTFWKVKRKRSKTFHWKRCLTFPRLKITACGEAKIMVTNQAPDTINLGCVVM